MNAMLTQKPTNEPSTDETAHRKIHRAWKLLAAFHRQAANCVAFKVLAGMLVMQIKLVKPHGKLAAELKAQIPQLKPRVCRKYRSAAENYYALCHQQVFRKPTSAAEVQQVLQWTQTPVKEVIRLLAEENIDSQRALARKARPILRAAGPPPVTDPFGWVRQNLADLRTSLAQLDLGGKATLYQQMRILLLTLEVVRHVTPETIR